MEQFTTPLRTPADLQSFIDHRSITARLIQGIGETPTVPAAAAALGVEPEQIIKTLLFLIERSGEIESVETPLIVISHGQKRVDKGMLAAYAGVGKKRVTLAPAEVVSDLLGYPAGGVPPFGHRTRLPVLVDATILALRERYAGIVYGGGGDDQTMMELTVDELLNVTGATVLAVSLPE
ncbi:MAG: YbaK/EbsC family protein [Anaerolineales bacterium]|nr:YbaK/EbsC family protein [Anaerolineales bacterium]